MQGVNFLTSLVLIPHQVSGRADARSHRHVYIYLAIFSYAIHREHKCPAKHEVLSTLLAAFLSNLDKVLQLANKTDVFVKNEARNPDHACRQNLAVLTFGQTKRIFKADLLPRIVG